MSLVIFDCDGVLVESEQILLSAELEFLADAGLPLDRETYIQQYMGMPRDIWGKLITAKLTEHLGRAPEANCLDILDASIQNRLKQDLIPVEGARSTLEKLDMTICVASSSTPEGLDWKLRHTGLYDLFSPGVFSTHLVERGKPSPDIFLYAADKMNFTPASCVVVEDSSNGVIAARSAGMKVIGFTAGSHCSERHAQALRADGADIIVDSYQRLPAVLKELLS